MECKPIYSSFYAKVGRSVKGNIMAIAFEEVFSGVADSVFMGVWDGVRRGVREDISVGFTSNTLGR